MCESAILKRQRAFWIFQIYTAIFAVPFVILGALFKLTHIAGADLMLFLGMGTEVIVFFLAGFERPYDDDGLKETLTDEVATAESEATPLAAGNTVIVGGGIPAGGTIVIGGGTPQPTEATGGQPAEQIDPAQLAGAIASSPIMTSAQFQGMCPEMQEATKAYVDQLTELTEVLGRVKVQAERMSTDSEEMENLNRTLTGIATVYELQLRSVSAQSATIDDVNAQTKRLAEQLEELNAVYARMVEALKVNMTTKAE